jgi:hypothetical protein
VRGLRAADDDGDRQRRPNARPTPARAGDHFTAPSVRPRTR